MPNEPPTQPRPGRNARARALTERIDAFSSAFAGISPCPLRIPTMPALSRAQSAARLTRLLARRLEALARAVEDEATTARQRSAFLRWHATATEYMEQTSRLRHDTDRALYSSDAARVMNARTGAACRPRDIRRAVRAMTGGGFKHVRIMPGSITITSPPVILEGVALGAFDVTLHVPTVGAPRPRMHFEALAPRPPVVQGEDEIHHPHIRHGQLCEGDAGDADAARHRIDRCLSAAAIPELFELLLICLQNYNERSTYQNLDDWRTVPCAHCARAMPLRRARRCPECARALCRAHMARCYVCSQTVCAPTVAPRPGTQTCSTEVTISPITSPRQRTLCRRPACREQHERMNTPAPAPAPERTEHAIESHTPEQLRQQEIQGQPRSAERLETENARVRAVIGGALDVTA